MKRLSILTVLSIISMLTNLAVQVVIAIHLGAGLERDVLFVAMSIPVFFNALMVSTVGVVITPTLISHGAARDQYRLMLRILISLLVGSAALAAILRWSGQGCVDLLAPGFDAASRVQTTELLSFAVWLLPVQAGASVLGGYFVTIDRVFLPSTAMIFGNCVMLVLMHLASVSLTAVDVVTATLIGTSLIFFVQFAALLGSESAGAAEVPKGDGSAPRFGLIGFTRQAVPLIFGGLISRSMPLIERNLASSMGVGTVSCLSYAGYLITFLVNATMGPMGTGYFARMCFLWNENRRAELGALLERNLTVVFMLSLASAGMFITLSPELVTFFPRISRLTLSDSAELILYSQILMSAYCALALGGLLSRLFYVVGASLQMVLLDSLAIVFYVAVAIGLSHLLDGVGLAVALGLHGVFVTTLFFNWARRQFAGHLGRDFFARLAPLGGKWMSIFALALSLRHLLWQVGVSHAAMLAAFVYAGCATWWLLPLWRSRKL